VGTGGQQMKKVVKQPKTDGLNMTTANEAEEIQKQTLDFISKHRDVFDALMDRITFLQPGMYSLRIR
jgi:hypothetical protein